jgi:membrane-associated phospholipid phosphatase
MQKENVFIKDFVNRFVRFFIEQKLEHAIPFILYLVGYLLWFKLLEDIPRARYHDLASVIDRLIPFAEIFIVPYISWFALQAAWVSFLFFYDRDAYDKLVTILMFGMTVFLVVSTIYPTALTLRPWHIARDNVFVDMVRGLWSIDTATNVWPSIHVYNTTALMFTLFTTKDRNVIQKVRIPMFIWCVLIILSTMFLKQHSVGDVLSGLALAGIGYSMVYIKGLVMTFRSFDRRVERVIEGLYLE